MSSHKKPKIGAVVLRILLFATLIAIMAYGAITPSEMTKVAAECVAIGVGGLAMAVQIYVTLAVYMRCIPYNVWLTIGLDVLCALAWVAAIAVLSHWNLNVVYSPINGDPASWITCEEQPGTVQVHDHKGFGSWINIVWCPVEVDGQQRLVGNGAAIMQLHVLIGLSTVALLWTGCVLAYTVVRASQLGLLKPKDRNPIIWPQAEESKPR